MLEKTKPVADVEQFFRPEVKVKNTCHESKKLFGVVWNLYDQKTMHEMGRHVDQCTLCQKELQTIIIKEEIIKSKIVVPALSYEQGLGLQQELAEVVKNTYRMSLKAQQERIANNEMRTDWWKVLKQSITPTVMGIGLLTLGSLLFALI